MRIMCIGDSLGLPRDKCPYESTWYYRLKKNFTEHEFVDFFVRGLLIKDALQRFDTYFRYYDTEVVIIQTGICDCSPRFINDKKLFPNLLIKICQALSIESFFWKLVKKGRRKADCVYTKYDTFLYAYNHLVDNLINNGAKKIIFVKIGHATDIVLLKSPFFNSNADRYNEAIDIICKQHPSIGICVDPLCHVEENDFVDGYHCSPNGMEKVYEALKTEILNYVKAR